MDRARRGNTDTGAARGSTAPSIDVGKRTLTQTISRSGSGAVAAGAGEQVTRASGSSGSPLRADTRQRLESSAGHDLSSVRVHTDDAAAGAARAMGAEAYATGQDIYFGAGNYDAGGNWLLAHEVAHTVQQRGAAPVAQAHLEVSTPGDSGEVVADGFADAFLAGRPHPLVAGSTGGVIARQVSTPDGGAPDASASTADAGGDAASSTPAASPDVEAEHRAACDAAIQSCQAEIDAVCTEAGAHTEGSGGGATAGPAAAGGGAPAVCAVATTSRPFNESVSELMQAQGLDAGAIATAWTAVQQQTASAYGRVFEISGTFQRAIAAMQGVIEAADRAGAAQAAAAARATAAALVTGAGAGLDTVVRSLIVNAAVTAIENQVGASVPCLRDQVEAALTGALPPLTLATIDFTTGTTRDVRLRITTTFHTYRRSVQGALEALAGTAFRPYIRGDGTGLHLDMLTQADHTARLAADDATVGTGPGVHAGHLHGVGSSSADVQTMMWDVYQYQQTSNDGHQLIANMIAGTGMNFDILMVAVNGAADVGHDAFIDNRVDTADIHAEPEVAGAGSTAHPQSRESVYAHFLHERYYDATHSATDMTALAAQGQALETERLALHAQFTAFPANVQTALQGGAPTPALTPVQITAATAFATAFTSWQTRQAAHQAAFDARFVPAHSEGIDRENDFNRERGFDDTRPH